MLKMQHYSQIFISSFLRTKSQFISAVESLSNEVLQSKRVTLFLLATVTACATVPEQTSAPTPPSVSVSQKTPRQVKIGLALGGGAARGFAHIGVIKALESQGIFPDIVVGTSAGSVVGAMYAAGNNGFALQKMALDMDEATISDWSLPLFSKSSGVLKGDALQAYVNRMVGQVPIEKLKKPFGAVATELSTGKAVLFQRGTTGAAVRASSAVPAVFQPVTINGRQYVDGGLVAPVPVQFARDMGADLVIAVNISQQPEGQNGGSTIDILLQSVTIMGQSINQYELKRADVVIRPDLPGMKGSDFAGRNLAMLAGERAAMALIPELKQKIKAMQDR